MVQKMANRRLSVISIREILRLSFSRRLSGRQIATSLKLSRSAVWECLRRAGAAKLSWPLPADLDDEGLMALLYPPVEQTLERPKPDCQYLFHELKRKGVTLSLLWEEHKKAHPNGYQYTQFCDIYRGWLKKTGLVMRQEHKAGQKVFSDFSGGTLNIVDSGTGEVKQAKLFVGALGASSFTYAELFFGETSEAWCLGQAHCFEYFQGTSEMIIPDNPRAVVTKACPYEPDINRDFLLLAQHFDVAVVPARIRRPKDKAVVEAAVGFATRWILARLRNHTFFSLAEANLEVRKLLEILNNKPFKNLPQFCRRSLFEKLDKPALKLLPCNKYEYTHIEYVTVGNDYHIEIEQSHYSVPYQLVGKRVEARVSTNIVEVFHGGKRVASHILCQQPKQLRRLDEHLPKEHRAYKDWTPARFASWAKSIGPATAEFVERLIAQKKYPELAYRSSFGVLKLAKDHGNSRLENACIRAMTINSYSYKTIKLILQNNMDAVPVREDRTAPQLSIIHSNIRGAQYFATEKEITNADTSNSGKPEEPEAIRNGEGPRITAADA
jgi:transposase